MEILNIQNYKEYVGKTINGWNIAHFDDAGPVYIIVLRKSSNESIFYIRKNVIKGEVLGLDNDVYELWYKSFEDAKLLTLSEVLNADIVLSKIDELIKKYN